MNQNQLNNILINQTGSIAQQTFNGTLSLLSSSPYINTPTLPKTMTRLTNSGDWTILLEEGKLVAVNSNGKTVRAVGSLLSADGKAWMWHNNKLWSGVLEETDTEAGLREKETQAKVRAMREKEAKLSVKEDKAICAVVEKFNKLRENLK